MIKRGTGFYFLVATLITVVLINFVSAADLSSYVSNALDGVRQVFQLFFGFLLDTNQFDEYFFVKVLFLIILVLLIRIALGSFPLLEDKKGVVNIIAIAVSLIAVRYLTEIQIIKGILLPYNTLAIAITTILPFIIFFFFVHKSIVSGIGRRIAWAFYMAVLAGLWINQSDRFDEISNYIYFVIFILAALLLIFDKKVKEYFDLSQVKEIEETLKAERIAETLMKYRMNAQEYMNSAGTNKFAQKTANKYAKVLRKYGVDVKDI